MESHKVAQNVEAEDKLLGPFTARQTIYLAIAAAGAFIAWLLSQVFIPLALIPLPIVIIAAVLALPLRKDQPMETYLAAIISFALKPKVRKWKRDGISELVTISAPKNPLGPRKPQDFNETETDQRLIFLSKIVDTKGWAIRNAEAPRYKSVDETIYNEANQIQDPLDRNTVVSQNLDTMITTSNQKHIEAVKDAMYATQSPQNPLDQTVVTQETTTNTQAQNNPHFDPYPTIQQTVINPSGQGKSTTITQKPENQSTEPPATQEQNTEGNQKDKNKPSNTTVSADIINLAGNSTLNVETIAREAKRISDEQEKDKDEVFISLR